jgi:hypothetical protein
MDASATTKITVKLWMSHDQVCGLPHTAMEIFVSINDLLSTMNHVVTINWLSRALAAIHLLLIARKLKPRVACLLRL